MNYSDGTLARLGDVVRLGSETQGVVVCSIDTDEYIDAYPKDARAAYLEKGILIKFELYGLIHYAEPDEDLEFLRRAK